MEKINIENLVSRIGVDYSDGNIALMSHLSDVHTVIPNEILVEGFLCAIVVKGTVTMMIEDKEYELHAGDIFACNPRNVLERSTMSVDVDARALFLSPDFADKVSSYVNLDWTFRIMALSHEILHTDSDTLQRILLGVELLRQTLTAPKSPNRDKCVMAIFSYMSYEFVDLHLKNGVELTAKTYTSSENMFQKFARMLEDKSTKYLSVNEYADRLNVTPKYFSAVCKGVVGKTASEIINESIIRDAQMMLRDSSYSVKQIADELGFANQSHFGSFFKRHTGLSPFHFRQNVLGANLAPSPTTSSPGS